MAFIACPNCKFIWCSWDANKSDKGFMVFHNKMIDQYKESGMPCPMCFCETKVVAGKAPETCHHGYPITIRCKECHKNDPEINNHINELKKLLK